MSSRREHTQHPCDAAASAHDPRRRQRECRRPDRRIGMAKGKSRRPHAKIRAAAKRTQSTGRRTVARLQRSARALIAQGSGKAAKGVARRPGRGSAMLARIEEILAAKAESLLGHTCKTIPKHTLHLPGPDYLDRIFVDSDRKAPVQRNLATLFNHGRLARTGYVSILPVDQGIEHSAGASFAPNPIYFDPANIVQLAIEGGCNAVASTLGVLGAVAKRYAHKIPFILKFNHSEMLTYPNVYDQVTYGSIQQAFDMGCVGVGATIYWGSDGASRQLQEVSKAFAQAHELGMFTVLWCYLRNPGFKKDGKDYHEAADLTGQANHLGVTLEADIIKQKLPTNNGGYKALNFGKTHDKVYSQLTSDHPIDLCRYQVANNYMGRIGLINSGGASGANDLQDAAMTAVINKRAGGLGLISGRKAFQKPMQQGVEILNTIQNVYLCKDVTIA
jgi:class I fructose-bisphosphate aldolase